jgi:hypothetical protein
MAIMEIEYRLQLNEAEVFALKKILGGMNYDDFEKLGICGDDRQRIADIWDLLPFEDDE